MFLSFLEEIFSEKYLDTGQMGSYSDAMFRSHLFIPGKRSYILGKNRPKVECILCTVLRGDDPQVENLLIYQEALVAVSVNLYPYNAGHLLVFPRRHIIDPREMTRAETLGIDRLTRHAMNILDQVYEPYGYNIGYNIRDASGASIEHLHEHLIPRYPKELGFVDIISGSKIIIEDPVETMEKLRQAFLDNPPPKK